MLDLLVISRLFEPVSVCSLVCHPVLILMLHNSHCADMVVLLLFSFMELQRERNQYPRSGMPMLGSGGGGTIQGMEDLSGLASIPFATWFAWCMR